MLDVHRGAMSWRTLRVLIEHLPSESVTMTAIRRDHPASPSDEQRDPDAGRWSQLEMLVAALIDEIRLGNFYLLRINGSKAAKPPRPVPRPGIKADGKPRRLSKAGSELLLNLINGKGDEERGD